MILLGKNAVLGRGEKDRVVSYFDGVDEIYALEGLEGGRCGAVSFSKVGELVAKGFGESRG